MAHQRTGRLHWDTTHAATPGWLLFLEAQPEDLLTMRPWVETRLPADASPAEVTHLIGELLQRGHRASPRAGAAHPACRRPRLCVCRHLRGRRLERGPRRAHPVCAWASRVSVV